MTQLLKAQIEEDILTAMNRVESVTGVIFSPDRSCVLLIQRRDIPVWVLPGGGVDCNESSEQAIVREILEETGFTVKVTRLVGHYTPINRLARPMNLYECEILSGNPILSAETRGIDFFPLNSLPKRLPPFYKDWICDSEKLLPPLHKKISRITYAAFFLNAFLHPILIIRFLLSRMDCPINTPPKRQSPVSLGNQQKGKDKGE